MAQSKGRDAMRLRLALVSAVLLVALGAHQAHAQISDDVVRIGVLNDQTGLYADLGGSASVVAARMAVEDFGGKVLGKPVDVISGDHQNTSDIGAAIAREWFDVGKVDMAIGFDHSAVALAVSQLGAEKNRIVIGGAIGSTAFTGKSCTPTKPPGSMTLMPSPRAWRKRSWRRDAIAGSSSRSITPSGIRWRPTQRRR